jgi:hypothetical protein
MGASPTRLPVTSTARISSVSASTAAEMDLAPLPGFRRSVLARAPFAVAADLDPGAVDEKVQRALRA